MSGRKSTKIECLCEVCGSPFVTYECWRRRGNGKYCSRRCAGKASGIESVATKFNRYVSDPEPSGCIVWSGAKNVIGYGKMTCIIDGRQKTLAAHRVAWELKNGKIAEGLFVCHKCDNPPCVNVDHLFLGTPKENAEDMVRKGRVSHSPRLQGSKKPNAVLDESAVLEMRRQYANGARPFELAAAFGVTNTYVCRVVHRKYWRHI